jgi:thiamine-phosphate pyrophosphorylase
LDANANRSREGLRVVEEMARFFINDAVLSQRLKGARHHLDSALRTLEKKGKGYLILYRDSAHDVWARHTLVAERQRKDLLEIVTANFKRTQESLRVLEEFSKILKNDVSDAFKALRFRVYSLEKDFYFCMKQITTKTKKKKKKKV